MSANATNPLALQADETTAQILTHVLDENEQIVVVDSPPGAGKTWLIEQLVGLATLEYGLRVCCVAATNEQVENLARRCSASFALPVRQAALKNQVQRSSERMVAWQNTTHT